MIRFRKDTPRYWFMSNYYSCEFVMNGMPHMIETIFCYGAEMQRLQVTQLP